MDHYPNLSTESLTPGPAQGAALPTGEGMLPSSSSVSLGHPLFGDPLPFPGDDGGRSLNEMAARDLEAALQLLAERAQYITGASGAAIALCEGDEMICRASSGPSAPAVGSRAEVSSGLSGESVRTRQILSCTDTANDPRVSQENCRAMGIASAMVMPLLRQNRVAGVFELLSGRAHAFEERDILALERLGEMIQTAVDHAEAATNAQSAIATPGNSALAEGPAIGLDPAGLIVERGKIRCCTSCGFPVSEGRTLCLDCSNARAPQKELADPIRRQTVAAGNIAPEIQTNEGNWLQSHKYLVGTVLAVVITVAVVIFLR